MNYLGFQYHLNKNRSSIIFIFNVLSNSFQISFFYIIITNALMFTDQNPNEMLFNKAGWSDLGLKCGADGIILLWKLR